MIDRFIDTKSKIFINCLIFFNLAVLLYLVSKSIFFYEENRFSEYIIYFFIVCSITTYFFVILFFSEKLRENSLISFFTIILLLYFVEAFLASGLANKIYNMEGGFQTFKKEKKKNPELVRTISPYHHIAGRGINIEKHDILPLGGISNRQTMYCNENGYYTFFKSDKHGFRGLDNNKNWNQKLDYLLTGDSQAFGACLHDEDTFVYQISENTKKKIINISYSANGPLMNFASVLEYFNYAKEKKIGYPNKVLMVYSEVNDLWDLQEELEVPILQKYLNEKKVQDIFNKQKKVDKLLLSFFNDAYEREKSKLNEKKSIEIIKNFLKLQKTRIFFVVRKASVKNRILQARKKKGFVTQKMLDDFDFTMSKFSSFLIENDVKLIVIYMPTWLRYADPLTKNFYEKKSVLSILEKNQIDVVDLDKQLIETSKDPFSFFPFGNEGHFNEIGSIKASKVISDHIVD